MLKAILISVFVFLAAAALPAQDLSATNVSKYMGDSRWTWTIFLNGSKEVLDSISFVEYTLHPTFPNPLQKVDRTTDPRYPFGYTATGWGVFEVGIKVVFKNGQVRYLRHMLQFVAASAENSCEAPFKLGSHAPRILSDPRFRDPVYVYVSRIDAEWTKRHPTLTILYGYSGTWKKNQYVFEYDFETQTKYVSPETKWTLQIQHEGDAIQFRYGTRYYLLTVLKVTADPNAPLSASVDLQVCERPPISGR